MSINSVIVTSAAGLQAVVRDASVDEIIVTSRLEGVKSLRLSPGQVLRAEGHDVAIHFDEDSDGLEIGPDNAVRDITLLAAPDKRIIFNDPATPHLGHIELRNLAVSGRVELIVDAGDTGGGFIDIDGLDIRAANTSTVEGSHGSVAGALTLLNTAQNAACTLTACLAGLRLGRIGKPLASGGIRVYGPITVPRLETGGLYCNADAAEALPHGASAIQVGPGAHVDLLQLSATIVTHGTRCHIIDNQGSIERCLGSDKLATHGTAASIIVNHGQWHSLELAAPLETRGDAADALLLRDGQLEFADLAHVATHGHGASALRVNSRAGRVSIRQGVRTCGDALEQDGQPQGADGIVIATSAKLRELVVKGGIQTQGEGSLPLILHGRITTLSIEDGVAHGEPSDRN